MKKRIVFIAALLVLLSGGLYLNGLMPVITGYAAKNLASGIFVAGRSQKAMEQEDLNFSLIKYTRNIVNPEKKEVTSRFLWGRSKAIYLDGFGCTLVNDYSEEEIRGRPYPGPAVLPGNPDTISWPAGDLTADTLPPGIDPEKLDRAVEQAMSDTIPYKGTFALMIVYKRQPVAEVYRDDFSRNSRFLSWSMAKSLTNALVGIRVKEGKTDINQPTGIAEWQGDERKNITIGNLLHMNSGLEWNEDYGNLSDVTIMLHKVGDMGGYTAQKPMDSPPGPVWVYSSGTTNLLCHILRRSFDTDADYYRFPREALFNKTGMRSAVFEVDASGTFVGSSYLYATMRDYARFALLYLNRGNWLGEQLLPEDWVEYTVRPANGSDGQYGAFFWLNLSGALPDAPRDMYMCRGHDGQFIFIVPSRELIVVRTGYSKKGEFDANLFLKGIMESLEPVKINSAS
ncbi:MAG: serine hydrolase [Prolixibacteraceae bacterium]|jgi:CubicO group peptidase (beta-lactamase class C family)|nr:serine hydrolase [Prolixibacteraceae bacterium]